MVSMMLGGGNQMLAEQLRDIFDTIETFVSSFDKFIGVFDDNYGGGDFCSGLIFGMQGTSMLEKVALNLFEQHK